MKTKLLIFGFVFLNISVFSQEFSTKIYFKDAVGRVDSITVGYALLATDSLNSALGEKNIPLDQIDTTFFVCISKIEQVGPDKFAKPVYRTKVKYADFNKPDYNRVLHLDVICKDFPFTISWNKNDFRDILRSKSCISTSPPGWSDLGGKLEWLGQTDNMVFYDYNKTENYSRNYLYGNYNENYHMDTIISKSIKTGDLLIAFFGHDFNVGVNDIINSKISIFPNPCKEYINIDVSNKTNFTIKIYNLTGVLVRNETITANTTKIDMSTLPSGIYLLKIGSINEITKIKIQKL
ncbi:MAG: T9SS type A sorting domain-containing protein [Paludibacter sp.]